MTCDRFYKSDIIDYDETNISPNMSHSITIKFLIDCNESAWF